MINRNLTWLILIGMLCAGSVAWGQTEAMWNVAGPANWTAPSSWLSGVPPEASFDELGIIDNGGIAFVQGTPLAPGGVILGDTGTGSGTLEVRSGGNLVISRNTMFPPGLVDGEIEVGNGGQGTLRILSGGTVTAEIVRSGGSAQSLIDLSGTASLTSNGIAVLDRRVQIAGPDVTFDIADSLALGTASTLIAKITQATHSAIEATGSASVRGALEVQFDGAPLAAGQTWDLVKGASMTGDFSSISVTGAGALGPGLGFRTRTVENAGLFTKQLILDRLLTLTVDRSNGSATIDNLGGTPISLDGYWVKSAEGALSTNNWTSFEDQAIGDWQEANPSANQLAELRETGSTTIGGMSSSAPLGGIFVPNPSELGVESDDLVFEYNVPGENSTFRGLVEYAGKGIRNNLVLTVDPDTGDAQMTNESQFFTAEIDGYRILSASNSLTPGTWTSLEDQTVSDWQEANPNSGALRELNETSSTLFSLNSGTKFDLGTIFNAASGTEDLVFEYLLTGEEDARLGVVDYEAIDAALLGDFSGNGAVENADLTLLLNNWAMSSTPVPAGWIGTPQPTAPSIDNDELTALLNNWGKSVGSGSVSVSGTNVPEPTTLVMALFACGLLVFGARGSGGANCW